MTADQYKQRFLPFQRQLYQQALALLGNEADAMDAVQETYLRLWRQADRIEEMSNAKGFYIQTLRNISLNIIRSRRNLTSLEQLSETVDDTDTALQEVILSEDHQSLRRAIGQLQPKARSIVTMFYFSQMSSQQIAEVTGETDANVRSILSRARAQLRELLLDHQKKEI